MCTTDNGGGGIDADVHKRPRQCKIARRAKARIADCEKPGKTLPSLNYHAPVTDNFLVRNVTPFPHLSLSFRLAEPV